MKKQDDLKKLRELDESGLRDALTSLQHEMMNLKFRQSAGQLAQSGQLKNVRRRIARVQTELSAR